MDRGIAYETALKTTAYLKGKEILERLLMLRILFVNSGDPQKISINRGMI